MTEEKPTVDAGRDQESAFQERVRRDLRRNYLGHVLHGMLGQTGFRLINAPSFIPAYLYALSGSDLVVGLARSLQYFGMFLSPILSATLIEHRRRVLPAGFAVGGLMRLQVLGIALAGFFLPGYWRLSAVCLFLGLFGFFLGMQGVIFNYLMSKVIPVEMRGRLLGLRNMLAGLTAATVAWLSGSYLVENNALGDGYAATFLVSFGLTSIGLCMLLLVREPEPPQVRERSSVRNRLSELPTLLQNDRQFAGYFASRALGTMGRMGMPFYVLFAQSRMSIAGTELGILTLVYILAQSTGNLLWGWLADRSGFRLVFILAMALWGGAVGLLMLSDQLLAVGWAYAGVGLGQGGFQMASQNMVLEFGAREDLPMRIAIVNSGSEMVGALGPLLGGIVAVVWSYTGVFWIALVFQLVAILVMLLFVEEPRRRATLVDGY